MRTIDIKTTQNVKISYEIAELKDRIFAFLIDFIVIMVASVILGLIRDAVYTESSILYDILSQLLIPSVFFFYTLIFETLTNGQTLGKMALRIKVVKLDGRQMKFFDFLLRWCFRMIDIWGSLGSLAAIMSTSGSSGQRLGGLVSGTTVVKLNPTLNITLDDLQKINTLENYEPKFPGIRNFKEEDLLLVKQTIERYQKYKNKAHEEAVIQLTEVFQQKLEIPEVTKGKVKFLKTLIKDYIVLTR